MKQSKLPLSLVKSYVRQLAIENHLPPTEFCGAQWKVMSEKMEHFTSLYDHKGPALLLFLYTWYNYREIDYDDIPWEKISIDERIPKEQFEQMYETWTSLENDVIEFTRINQKIMEQQRKQEPEQER